MTFFFVPGDVGSVRSEGPGEEKRVFVLLQEEDGHYPDAVQDQEGHHHLVETPGTS